MFLHYPDFLSSLSDVPRLIWNAYVKYLWNYQPESWVGRTASTFRFLAVAVILPVIILTLLDVTSYIIARTLGILDDMKASTSDTVEDVTMSLSAPTTLVQSSFLADEVQEPIDPGPRAASDSEGQRPSEVHCDRIHNVSDADRLNEHGNHEDGSNRPRGGESRPQGFFAEDEGLQLSGVGVFSPAASQPSSPVSPRMKLSMLEGSNAKVTEGQSGSSIKRRHGGGAGH